MEKTKTPTKSGFVAGAYLPELTEELIEKALAPIEGRDERIITINREILWKGAIVSPWNIKTYTKAWKWIDSHRDMIKIPAEKLEEWRTYRRLPKRFMNFVRHYIGDTKPDAYGLPGGTIEQYEYDESNARRQLFLQTADYENSGEHYSDYAFHREWVEETGLLAIRENKPLFERVIQFYEDDFTYRDDLTIEHEDFFFWVHEVIGQMNKVGVVEETLAPEIVPIMALNRWNFYTKHAQGLMAILNRVVNEYGQEQCKEALEYLQRTFPLSKKLRREPRIRIPEMSGLSDKQLFEYAMALDKIKPLER